MGLTERALELINEEIELAKANHSEFFIRGDYNSASYAKKLQFKLRVRRQKLLNRLNNQK